MLILPAFQRWRLFILPPFQRWRLCSLVKDIIRLASFAFLFSLPLPLFASTSSYHVGNSLTVDASVPYRFAGMVAAQGRSLSASWHISCNQSLLSIYNGAGTCVPTGPAGTWMNALPNYEWDFVTYQPYTQSGSTLGTDESVINSMANDWVELNPNNADTVHYVYATWPSLTATPWSDRWTQSITNDPDTPTSQAAEFYEHLMNNLHDSQSVAVPMRMIPAGHAMYVFDQLATSGGVGDATSVEQLYRDDVHLNDAGKFLLDQVWYATLFGDPRGLSYTSPYSHDLLTPEFLATSEKIAWNVVRSNRHTGLLVPGDMDGDQNITASDPPLFNQALVDREGYLADYPGVDLDVLADFDGNGHFDEDDLEGFNEMFSGTVPEPTSFSAAVLTLLGMLLSRTDRGFSRFKARATNGSPGFSG